jgi:hypothetical protein
MLYLDVRRGVFSKVVLGFWNFGYDFWGVEWDVWRWLCRHMHRKISAHADGGTSERSGMHTDGERRPPSMWAEILFSDLSSIGKCEILSFTVLENLNPVQARLWESIFRPGWDEMTPLENQHWGVWSKKVQPQAWRKFKIQTLWREIGRLTFSEGQHKLIGAARSL